MIGTVLTIAGSDPSGGAGIQADLKTIAAHGSHGASVVTAITAQNTRGVTLAEALPLPWIHAQLSAVLDDLDVRAAKTGMLASADVIRVVAGVLRSRRIPSVVCDPVMIAKSGHALLAEDAVAALRAEILPLADLVTPNTHEARVLSGMHDVRTIDDARRAAERILRSGAKAVLVKGGHLSGAPASDVLVTAEGRTRVFEGDWVESIHTHGTGCTYSAAIAARLAQGHALEEAIGLAKEFVGGAIRGGLAIGHGIGPTDPFYFLHGSHASRDGARETIEPGTLHVLTDETLGAARSHEEIARRAAEGGADVVQFREKRAWSTARLVAAARAVAAAVAGTRARVVVNDRVDVAAAAGIDAVHLGVDDLEPRIARRVLGPRSLIGATAHTLDEARHAAAQPIDYLGVGPVFGTTSKPGAPGPLGLDGLASIVSEVRVPVIAIGSITAERVADVLAAGARGIAVLSAVLCDEDPTRATRRLRDALDACRAGARA